MHSALIARTRHWSPLALSLVAFGVFFVLAAIGYALVSRVPAPDYGTWTGIRPLETKLRALEEFAAAGDVDALILGSSITEFGFNAKLFSELMTRKLGREYRAYNFASGGAEPRTLPKLYRLARTVSRPKTVFVVVPAEQKLVNKIYAGSPDLTLQNAPVGSVIQHPLLLEFNRRIWNTRLLRNAPALRDLLVFGEYRNLAQAVGMESYALSSHGDRQSFLVTWKAQDLPAMKLSAETSVRPFPAAGAPADEGARLEKMLDTYFARLDIDAMEELKNLVRGDGGKIVLVSHAAAATLWGGPTQDAEYAKGRRDFFAAFARKLQAPFWDPVEILRVPLYCVSDVTHLNVHGAEMYTRAMFAVGTGGAEGAAAEAAAAELAVPPVETMFPTQDKTFNLLSALTRRPPGQAHPLFKFRTVTSLAVPPLPKDDFHVALRLPDNRDIVVPAVPLGAGDFVAEVNLPPAARAEGILVRVLQGEGPEKLALLNPLEDYEWLQSWPRTPLVAPPPQAPVQALVLPPVRNPGAAVYLAMRSSEKTPAAVAVRLTPLAPGSGAAIDLGRAAPGAGELLKVSLPAAVPFGEYEVEVYEPGTRRVLAKAPPLRVTEPAGAYVPASLRVVGKPAIAEGKVKLAFSGVRKPTATDWIGLFPVGGKPETRLDIILTKNRAQGEIVFPISVVLASKVASGEFEFRLYAAGGWLQLAATEPFSFDAAPRVEPTPAGENPVTLASEPNPPLAAGNVKVKWAGIRKPADDDWIGIFPMNGRPEDRMDFIFTRGRAQGEASFPISSAIAPRLAKGEYEFRLYAKGGWALLARGTPFRFDTTSPPVAAAPAAAPVAAKEAAREAGKGASARVSSDPQPSLDAPAVKVRWSGIGKPSQQDWIGLYPAGGKAEDRLDFVFIHGKPEGEIAFPISSAIAPRLASGQYEFRIYAGWTQLAQSDRITFVRAR